MRPDEVLSWLMANAGTIAMLLGSLTALATVIVALTPTTRDDKALRRLMEYASLIHPPDVRTKTGKVFSAPGTRGRDA
jgi:hypothetical protein